MGKLKQGVKADIAYPNNQYIGRSYIDDVILRQLNKIDEEITNKSDEISKHIINIYGEAGVGKTTTQKHIIESLVNSENNYRKGRGIPIKYLFFDLKRECLDKYSFIIRVIECLRSKYSMNDFICTTCALYKLSKSTGKEFNIDLLSQINEQINKKATKVALRTAESVKWLSNFLEIGGIILSSDNKSNKEIYDAFEKRAEITDGESFNIVKSIIRSDINAIDDNIMLYFIQDLRLMIEKLRAPIIFCIESFDIQTAGTSLWDFEVYIRELVEELSHILWIISSRDCFSEFFPGWKKTSIINIELHPFTETLTKEYVMKANLPIEISELFYKLSKGNPRRLRQLHIKYLELKERNDNYLDENNY